MKVPIIALILGLPFSMGFFPRKKKRYSHEILDMFYSWVISAMDPHAKAAELIATGSQLSEDAALTYHCFFSQSFTEQRSISIYSLLKLYQTLNCEEKYSNFVFLIFNCVIPKDSWQFTQTRDVVRAEEKSYHGLLTCCLFPTEVCSDFHQHIVSQWLFFFFLMFLDFGWHPDRTAADDY